MSNGKYAWKNNACRTVFIPIFSITCWTKASIVASILVSILAIIDLDSDPIAPTKLTNPFLLLETLTSLALKGSDVLTNESAVLANSIAKILI